MANFVIACEGLAGHSPGIVQTLQSNTTSAQWSRVFPHEQLAEIVEYLLDPWTKSMEPLA